MGHRLARKLIVLFTGYGIAGLAHAEGYANSAECRQQASIAEARQEQAAKTADSAYDHMLGLSGDTATAYLPTVQSLQQAAKTARLSAEGIRRDCFRLQDKESAQAAEALRRSRDEANAKERIIQRAAADALRQGKFAEETVKRLAGTVTNPKLQAAKEVNKKLDKASDSLLSHARADSDGEGHPIYDTAVKAAKAGAGKATSLPVVGAIQDAAMDEIQRQHNKTLDNLDSVTRDMKNFNGKDPTARQSGSNSPPTGIPIGSAPGGQENPWAKAEDMPKTTAKSSSSSPAASRRAAGSDDQSNPWSTANISARSPNAEDPWLAEKLHKDELARASEARRRRVAEAAAAAAAAAHADTTCSSCALVPGGTPMVLLPERKAYPTSCGYEVCSSGPPRGVSR